MLRGRKKNVACFGERALHSVTVCLTEFIIAERGDISGIYNRALNLLKFAVTCTKGRGDRMGRIWTRNNPRVEALPIAWLDGLIEKKISKVFEFFFQVRNSDKSKLNGPATMFGLSKNSNYFGRPLGLLKCILSKKTLRFFRICRILFWNLVIWKKSNLKFLVAFFS